jgi:hypothetical protein
VLTRRSKSPVFSAGTSLCTNRTLPFQVLCRYSLNVSHSLPAQLSPTFQPLTTTHPTRLPSHLCAAIPSSTFGAVSRNDLDKKGSSILPLTACFFSPCSAFAASSLFVPVLCPFPPLAHRPQRSPIQSALFRCASHKRRRQKHLRFPSPSYLVCPPPPPAHRSPSQSTGCH